LPQPENGTAYAGTSLLQIDTDLKLKMAFFKGDYLKLMTTSKMFKLPMDISNSNNGR
jgi:hypothetical protein